MNPDLISPFDTSSVARPMSDHRMDQKIIAIVRIEKHFEGKETVINVTNSIQN